MRVQRGQERRRRRQERAALRRDAERGGPVVRALLDQIEALEARVARLEGREE
jgi:hypothetical protein